MGPKRFLCVAIVLVLGLTGCSEGSGGGGEAERTKSETTSDFRTTFTRIAPEGYVDLSLDISNPTDRPVTLRGKLVARDQNDVELSQVRVTTAFGTEEGRAVVMPGGSVDFVQLQGPGAEQVRDVTLEAVAAERVDRPVATRLIELFPLDASGAELDYDLEAQQIRLENPNPDPVRVRVVLMVLQAPEEGVPQEAILVRDVTIVDLKADATKTIKLDSKTRDTLQSRGLSSFVTLRPVLAP